MLSFTYALISKSASLFANLLGIFQVHQLQLVSSSPSCSIDSSALEQGPDSYRSFNLLLILIIIAFYASLGISAFYYFPPTIKKMRLGTGLYIIIYIEIKCCQKIHQMFTPNSLSVSFAIFFLNDQI